MRGIKAPDDFPWFRQYVAKRVGSILKRLVNLIRRKRRITRQPFNYFGPFIAL